MPKAYSDDLRRKLIEAHRQGEGSLAELAGRFHVSAGWAGKVSAAYTRTGKWARQPQSRYGRHSKFTSQVRDRIRKWIDAKPDLTLRELQARLRTQLKLQSSLSRLCGLLRKMELGLKKRRSTRPNKTARRTASGARNGVSK